MALTIKTRIASLLIMIASGIIFLGGIGALFIHLGGWLYCSFGVGLGVFSFFEAFFLRKLQRWVFFSAIIQFSLLTFIILLGIFDVNLEMIHTPWLYVPVSFVWSLYSIFSHLGIGIVIIALYVSIIVLLLLDKKTFFPDKQNSNQSVSS